MSEVDTQHREYDEYLPQWNRCADVVAGQRAIHAGREKYLPKLKEEDESEYKARLARSDFFNATFRTISGLVGMAFRKDPVAELPSAIEPFAVNIDLAGTSLQGLAKRLCEEVLEAGRIGILVDHPKLVENISAISAKVAEQRGLRPTLKLYTAKSITNWRFDVVGNATVLVMVTLKESVEVRDGEFKVKCEDRFRVLDLDESGFYRQRVYRVKDGKDELLEGPIYPQMGGRALAYVPFFIVCPTGFQLCCEEPPLIDLVDKNIAHYQVNSDYRHGAHYTALPTLFLAGLEDDDAEPIYIGSSKAITSRHPEARGEFIEYKGQGLGALERQLDRLERQMAVLGARMIADETQQVETLGATQIKRAGENSVLASIVGAVSDVIVQALTVMAQWVGATGEIKYEINREFSPVGISSQDLIAYMQQVQAGLMSEQEYYELLQRGDVIDGAKPFEEHQEEIGQAGPARPDPLAPDPNEQEAA